MFVAPGWFGSVAVFAGFLIYVLVIALFVWVGYLVIRAAVRSAMDDHYRKLQWYQQTGLWYSGRPPKGLPGAQELSRSERKDLPKDERPE
jgi:hypothetical protein